MSLLDFRTKSIKKGLLPPTITPRKSYVESVLFYPQS